MSDTAVQTRYERFADLHRGPGTFIMPNVWDGPSALLFKEAGFRSIATSSAVLAATLGRLDGIHAVGRDEHLNHAALLTSVSGLPINGDFEDGYGETLDSASDGAILWRVSPTDGRCLLRNGQRRQHAARSRLRLSAC
ncbi:isocitrate lyase/phosphoenolpyruvate mutase family protein [Nonomuraea sp. NPDC049419]|uniref:isocitrate lyase/phosphoenolpyruvate mutase family protein n=1 Tax=Nonomuraea sp. NPDC049419 TaxID=3155772 RepID=UPI003416C9E6